MPRAACPRCQTVVSYEEGGQPTCHVCGYPGPDVRAAPTGPAPGAAQPAAPEPRWQPAPSAAPAAAQPARTSGKAVASLVLGIASIVLYFLGPVLGVIGLVLGIMARREIRESEGAVGGGGLAVAGIVTSIIGIVVMGVIVLAAVVFVLVSDLGEEPARAMLAVLAR